MGQHPSRLHECTYEPAPKPNTQRKRRPNKLFIHDSTHGHAHPTHPYPTLSHSASSPSLRYAYDAKSAPPVPQLPPFIIHQYHPSLRSTHALVAPKPSDPILPPYVQNTNPHVFTFVPSPTTKGHNTRCYPVIEPTSPPPVASLAAEEAADAQAAFYAAYPEYTATHPVDLLRSTEYSRLRPSEAYVDSMGGALYPELLVRSHATFLEKAVLGNTHSQSSSSQLSMKHAADARAAVLTFFNAPPGSKVVFTANASQALKLIGESFPFTAESTYMLPEDAHNSVHGIREFAHRAGANVVYMPGRKGCGGVDAVKARAALEAHAPTSGEMSLAAFTGLSNLTNVKIALHPIQTGDQTVIRKRSSHRFRRLSTKNAPSFVPLPTPPPTGSSTTFSVNIAQPAASLASSTTTAMDSLDVPSRPSTAPSGLGSKSHHQRCPSLLTNASGLQYQPSLLTHAKNLGYTTLLDAAALAPSSTLDLTETPVDAVAVSFYKMFGYPTGVGALILAPGVGEMLLARTQNGRGGRPWFAGGTVDVVQVPGATFTHSSNVEEAFEDGTLNYLQLPIIPLGLNFLRSYLPFIPTRCAALAHYLAKELSSLRHADGSPAIAVLSRVPGWIPGVNGGSWRRLPSIRKRDAPAATFDAETDPDDDRDGEGTGGTVSFVVLSPNGDRVPLSMVANSAAANGIMLRTGCMCNPGGAAALLELSPFMAGLRKGATLATLEEAAGHELGVVRVSFGLASNFSDAWAVICWARMSVFTQWEGFRAGHNGGHDSGRTAEGGSCHAI